MKRIALLLLMVAGMSSYARGGDTLPVRGFCIAAPSPDELATESGLSETDVKRLVKVCRENNIRLIPQINLLGHQSWAEEKGKLLAV
jgi:hypothetical protein